MDEDGFDFMKISFLRDIKAQNRSLRFIISAARFYILHCTRPPAYKYFFNFRDYSKTYARSKYYDESKPWNERCDVAFPCASQNEIDQSDAINLVNSGCRILVEGNAQYFADLL